MTIDTAEDKCVSEGGAISSIHSDEENAFVVQLGGGYTDLDLIYFRTRHIE